MSALSPMRGLVPFAAVLLSFSLAVATFTACGSSSDGGTPGSPGGVPEAGDESIQPDGDAGADAPRTPPPPLPIIPNNGGPIVASPEVITVTWTGDPIATDLEAFDDWMVPSDFWKTLMAEWGVGPGTHGGTYHVATPAPTTLDDGAIRTLLADAFTSGALLPPNGSRIYTVYPPAGTTVTNYGTAGCEGFQAYHSAFTPPAVDGGAPALAIYAVTPRCEVTQGMTPTDYTTWGASHEVMEAASDPNPQRTAWVILEQTDATPELGENADLCTGNPTLIDGHMVTRNWSNVAAAKGERPCVPAPPGPMFGAYADPVTVAPGSSATTTVKLYTTAPMPAFQLVAYPSDPNLSAMLSSKTGNDGDEVTLTVSAKQGYTETPGANLVFLVAGTKDYTTRRAVIVHAK